mgnify:CR=1 FL=1
MNKNTPQNLTIEVFWIFTDNLTRCINCRQLHKLQYFSPSQHICLLNQGLQVHLNISWQWHSFRFCDLLFYFQLYLGFILWIWPNKTNFKVNIQKSHKMFVGYGNMVKVSRGNTNLESFFPNMCESKVSMIRITQFS